LGGALQYISDVLKNISDCAINAKSITNAVWKPSSTYGEYISSIVSSACDATLKIGLWKSIGISTLTTCFAHLTNWIEGKPFNVFSFIKDLVWNVLLAIVTNSICKKFQPKQGKRLNEYIRKKFRVKGTKAYKEYWNLLSDCVEWNGYFWSTIVDKIRSAGEFVINFVEVTIRDCIIVALEEVYQ